MKLTPLQLSFCMSLLVHGAALSVFYVARHSSADAKPAPMLEDLGTLEVLAEPETQVIPVSETQPVKVLEPAPQPVPVVLSTVPDARLEIDAVEIFPPAEQDNPVTTETPQPAPSLNESKNAAPGISTPAVIPSNANYLSNPKPVYPTESRQRKEQGLVVLGVTVNGAGHPADVWVIQSSGYTLLDQSAQTAVTRWQFVPARVGNMAISSQVQVPIRFRLSD